MDNEKLIAQISSSEEAWVDRVGFRRNQNTSLSSRLSQSEELRKKTIKIEGMAKSRLTKLRIQDSFEKLKKHLYFEYGDSFTLNLKSSEMTIYSRWIEGNTLADLHQKEDSLKANDISRIKYKLKLWVRIFEHLSFFHSKGIIHGNIKPENILIRDRTSVDFKHVYESEFFDKKVDVPHVILLDGGYNHLIEFQKEYVNYETLKSKLSTEKKSWLSPEAHGFLEGSYKENSDIFSLAAVMAWDFGLIGTNRYSIFNSLWSIYNTPENNSFCLGNKVYKCSVRNSLSDLLKRLRIVLLRALEPMAEKRTIGAKDIAFEIMVMTNRLVDTLDLEPQEITDIEPQEKISLSHKNEILLKNFELPEKIIPFFLNNEKDESNRLWIEARNKTANKHTIMRSINSGLNIIGSNCFYFGVKTTQSKIPFYNLDIFCNSILSHILHTNPQFIEEVRVLFSNIGSQLEPIFFVLPSLRNYVERIPSKKANNKNNLIQVQHESIQKNIENLIIKIIQSAHLDFVMIDDINRSDYSSIAVFLKLLTNPKVKLKWVIGIRLDEDLESEIAKKNILKIKHKDLTFASLKDNRTISYWITKLNTLSKSDAKILSTFSLNPTDIDFETFEILSNRFIHLSENFFYNEINVNKKLIKDSQDNDLIPLEVQTGSLKPASNLEASPEKQNKDNLFLASEALKQAINIGLISENRDISSGHLVSYYWEHQFIIQCLSMLLKPEVKADIYHSLFDIYQSNLKEKKSLAKIIHIADCLMQSKINQSHMGVYSALVIAAEEICDLYSAEYIIKKLQLLEEKIEIERPKDASLLIPKIREKIADLSRSINKNDIAVKYYDAVGWNVVNMKKRSILMIKSFFPSQIKNRDIRTKEFYKILNIARKSKFFPLFKNIKSSYFSEEIIQILNKIHKKISDENSYLENAEYPINRDICKIILVNNNLSDEINDEEIQNKNLMTYKTMRDKVMSYFFRSSIGWIDNSHIYPYVIKTLHLASENNDAESIVHLLFTLLLTCERNISLKLRSAILETITDLAGRIDSTFTLYEILLIRAWFALFYDGNLIECKKNIDRLNSSYYELPYTIKQCAKKIQLLYEFESLPLKSIENPKTLSQKFIKIFHDYELSEWNIGYEIAHLKTFPIKLKSVPGDSLFIGNILNEKIDQILLHSYYLIEEGQSNAASLVCNEAKALNLRQWFIDPSSHIEYMPEKLATSYIEYSLAKTPGIILGDKFEYDNFKENLSDKDDNFIKKNIYKLKSLIAFKEISFVDMKLNTSYWGEDKAILYNIKIDIAKTQDTEKLHFLAQNMFRSGLFWSAYRIAHKTRCNLTTIVQEVHEIDKSLQASQNIPENSHDLTKQKIKEENGWPQYEKSMPYPEQGVALNYILEFLHNFQHQIQKSNLTHAELTEVAEFIRKSIPKDTDLIESTLAGALKASAKRLHIHDESEEQTDDSALPHEKSSESADTMKAISKAG